MALLQGTQTANAGTLLIAMLETPDGIAQADAIAAVSGIDMLLIGANDLSNAIGVPGELHHPRLREAFAATAAACKAHKEVLGIGGVRGDLELQTEFYRLGGIFIIAGHDVAYLQSAARTHVNALRSVAIKN